MTPPVSATRRRPARQAGISLIESMVALVIAAVLLGLAVPSMLELIARKRLAAVATELASDLRYLTSVGMKDTRQTNLDVGATCYVLVIDTLGSGAACDCTKPLPCGTSTFGRVVLKRLVIPDSTGITLTSAKAHSSFSTDGFLNGPNPIVMTIESSLGGKVKVYTVGKINRPYVCSVTKQESNFPACP